MAQISLDVELRDDRRAASPSLFSSASCCAVAGPIHCDPMGLLKIDLPSLAPQKNMNAPIAVADPRSANLLDPGFKTGLLAATGSVMKRGTIEFQDAACSPDRYTPVEQVSPATATTLASCLVPAIAGAG